MKRKGSRFIVFTLVAALLLTSSDVTAFAQEQEEPPAIISADATEIQTSGTCGENLTWSFDVDTKTLTISGTGEMENFKAHSPRSAPWTGVQVNYGIETLVLQEGITSISEEAFYLCYNLCGELVIPKSVRTIGRSAFSNCYKLQGSLVIPYGVESIGEQAFLDCRSLDGDLIIADSVKSIGKSAFANCNGFTGKLVLSKGLTEISDQTFSQCTKFTGDLVIPENVTRIGNSAFSSCGFDGKLVLPDRLTTIEDYAFASCSKLQEELVLPESITELGHSVFIGCKGFTGELVIPGTLSTISSDSFRGCSGLESLHISEGVQTIGHSAFERCIGLRGDLVIPKGVVTIEGRAFNQCEGLDGKLVLPSGLETIGDGAFALDVGLTGDLVLPNSVTSLGTYAFEGCEGFQGNLILSNGLTEIKSDTFSKCSGLTGELILPEGITSIGWSAFYLCRHLTGNLVIPSTMVSLDNAFINCSGFSKDVYVKSDSMEYLNYGKSGPPYNQLRLYSYPGFSGVNDDAFPNSVIIHAAKNSTSETVADTHVYYGFEEWNREDLESNGTCGEHLTWEYSADSHRLLIKGYGDMASYDSYQSVPWSLFSDAIYEIVFSEDLANGGITSISDYAFYNCSHPRLRTITLPTKLTAIGNYAFYNSQGLEKIAIKAPVISIGKRAFAQCSNLDEIFLPKTLVTISDAENGSVFDGCSELITVEFEEGIENIPAYVCYGIDSLKNVKMPSSVKTIGAYSFAGCRSLRNVYSTVINEGNIYIPYETTTIADHAFQDCEAMTKVYMSVNVSSIGEAVFISDTAFDLSDTEHKDRVFYCIKDSYVWNWATTHHYRKKAWDNNHEKDVLITGKGNGIVTIELVNAQGELLRNKNVTYQFDGGSSVSAKSDTKGLLTVKTPTIEHGVNPQGSYTAKIMDNGKEVGKVVFHVTTEPLTFVETWESQLSVSLGKTWGEFEVPGTDIKASLGQVGVEGGAGGVAKLVSTHTGEQEDLLLTQSYTLKIAANASVGLAASAEEGLESMSVKFPNISGEAEVGAIVGTGLSISDYSSAQDHRKIGKYLISSTAQATGNPLLMAYSLTLGSDASNVFQYGSNVHLQAGADMGSFSYSINGAPIHTNAGENISADYQSDYLKIINNEKQSQTTRITQTAGVQTTPISSMYLIPSATEISKNSVGMTLQLDEKNDAVTDVTILQPTGSTVSQSIDTAYETNLTDIISKSTTYKMSFEGSQAQKLCHSGTDIDKFANGNIALFLPSDATEITKYLDSAEDLSGKVSLMQQNDLGKSLTIDTGDYFKVKGFSAKFQMLELYTERYDKTTGVYQNGSKEITAENDIEDLVAAKERGNWGFLQVMEETIGAYKDDFQNALQKVYGSVENAINLAGAKLESWGESVADSVKGWKMSIYTLSGVENHGAYMSFAVYNATDFGEDSLGTASEDMKVVYTIGNPYVVEVEDENGSIITDLSANPLKLTLQYTDEMLRGAGLDLTYQDKIKVYQYSQLDGGLVCVGGTNDQENHAISVMIKETGQYLLAIDSHAPSVESVSVTKGRKPVITIVMDENSGYSNVSIQLDGEEIIQTSHYREYYDASSQRFTYAVSAALSYGTHQLRVNAVDSAGNAMQEPFVYAFTIGDYFTVSFDSDGGSLVAPITGLNAGDTITLPANPTKAGHAFRGWFTERNGGGTQLTSGTVISGNLVVYAYWVSVDDWGDILEEDRPADCIIPEGLWITNISPVTYTGKKLMPTARVYDGKTLLVEKKDYIISYKNHTNASSSTNASKAPTIQVKGIGNYAGTATRTFQILPYDLSGTNITAKNLYAVLSKKRQKPVPTVYDGTKKLVKGKDYTVSYPDTQAGAYQAVGTYQILVKGIGNYSGEKMVTLTISDKVPVTKLSISSIKAQAYTGAEIKPDMTIQYKKKILDPETDYQLEYLNHTEIGTAKVKITGKGDYFGVKLVSFQIVGTPISKATVEGIEKNVVYTGNEITQNLTLTVKKKDSGTVTLHENEDYTVSYLNHKKVGTATIVLTGIHGYSGTVKKTFKITPYHLKEDARNQITFSENLSVPYEIGGSKPEPVVKMGDTLLVKDVDYKLTYQNNTKANAESTSKTPMIIVNGKGNFKGKLSIPFTITKQDLSLLKCSVSDKAYKKQAGAYKSALVIYDVNGKKLSAGRDYEKKIRYTDTDTGKEIGSREIVPIGANITISIQARESGNYTGSCSVSYRITKADFSKAKVTIAKQYYSGKEIKPTKESIIVKLGDKKLSEADYEIVEYGAKCINKGTNTIVLRGLGDYGGTVTAKYTIQTKGMAWWK